MRHLKFLLIMFFLLAMKTINAAETEPNNTKATANTLALNGSTTGAINSAGDEDWFKIVANADGKLDVNITVSNSLTLRCYIYDNDGTTLLSSGYSSSTTTVTYDGAAAGTYYVKLIAFYSTQTPAYTVSNTLTLPAQANDAEPNDNKTQATVLPLNGSKTGHVGYYYNLKRDTADWYKITTNADGLLRVSVTPANGETIRIYLYDNNGTTLLNSAYSSSKATLDEDGLATGIYFVRVFSFYDNHFEPYTISDSLIKPAQANDVEPNDNKTQATVLPQDASKTGHVGYYYNLKRDTADWYKITTNADGMLRLTLTPANSETIRIYLYDNDGTTLLNSAYSSSKATVEQDGLAAGTYYARVFSFYDNHFEPYTISDSLITYNYSIDLEPNKRPYQSKTILANKATNGHVGFYYNNSRDSVDWWKINYTGSGNLDFTIDQEPLKDGGGTNTIYFQVYKDTNAAAIHSSYSSAATRVVNLTGLAGGYYWIKIYTFYNNKFSSYSFTNTFTQVDKAKIAITAADTSNACDSANSISFKCTKSRAPYTVQLYRYNLPYGSVRVVRNSAVFTFTNLPHGNYYATAFGDGATGNAFGKSPLRELIPTPTNARTTAITNVQARLNWNAVSCANYFSIQYKKENEITWTTKNTNSNTTFYLLKNLTASTKYYWRVASADSSNNVSGIGAYTDSISFTTAAAFAMTAVESDAITKANTGGTTLKIYPNPATSFFGIQFNSLNADTKISATLRNANNTILWNKNNIPASTLTGAKIDVSNFPGGVYILEVRNLSDNKSFVTKVVVVK